MLNVNHLIQTSGSALSLLIIFTIIFFESGIPVGFFLPGDTMLFTAGFFAAEGYLPLGWLILVVIIAKSLGSWSGYMIGEKFGRKIFNKEESFFFRKEYIESSEVFYAKHGGKAVLIGQFIPIIRTFAPVVAGMGKMKKSKFMVFNITGAVLWAFIVIMLGYWLGNRVHNIDKYLIPIVILAMIFSFAPAGWHLFGKKENRAIVLKKLHLKR